MQCHLQDSILTCAYCFEKMPPKQWREHVFEKHSASKCMLCDDSLSKLYVRNPEPLTKHIHKHLPILPEEHWPNDSKCSLCDFAGDRSALLEHIRKEHLTKDQVTCPICHEDVCAGHSGSKLLSKSVTKQGCKLALHIMNRHIITQAHQEFIHQFVHNICLICGDITDCGTECDMKSFRDHILQHAMSCYTMWKCPLCEYIGENRAALYRHLMGDENVRLDMENQKVLQNQKNKVEKEIKNKNMKSKNDKKAIVRENAKEHTKQGTVLESLLKPHTSVKQSGLKNSEDSENLKSDDFLSEGKDVIHVPDIKIKSEPLDPTENNGKEGEIEAEGAKVEIKKDDDGIEFFEVHISPENELELDSSDDQKSMDNNSEGDFSLRDRPVSCDRNRTEVQDMGLEMSRKLVENCKEEIEFEDHPLTDKHPGDESQTSAADHSPVKMEVMYIVLVFWSPYSCDRLTDCQQTARVLQCIRTGPHCLLCYCSLFPEYHLFMLNLYTCSKPLN